jgi:hypothetical protein
MTIIDLARTARSARSNRIGPDRFADELARHLQDVDAANSPAKARYGPAGAVHDATDTARESLDRAAELARGLGRDLVKAGGDLHLDGRLDEVGQRIRATASASALRAVIARLERELPEMDRDRYSRAYHRGRAQARSKYLLVGIAAGATAGVVAALLLDPRHGTQRRERFTSKASSLTQGLRQQASGKARCVSDRARAMAIKRGLMQSGAGADPQTAAGAVEMVPPVEAVPAEAVPAEAVQVEAVQVEAVPAEAVASEGSEAEATPEPVE